MTSYAQNIGNTAIREQVKGRSRKSRRLTRYLHMALTGSRTKRKYGTGPYQ